jgi:3-deoxy-manno-octulosonate cytidylyltransferase (CMP-KDO synthetase)
VACADAPIADAIVTAGGKAVMTRPDHPSGSDRIHEALLQLDPAGKYDAVVNVQGDLPTIDPAVIGAVLEPLQNRAVDMATLAAEITDPAERSDPNVVKAVVDLAPGARIGRALYFSRAAIPTGDGPLLHHIGLYAFTRAALTHFVALPESPLEKRERLEQLRALAAGMRIDVALVDTVPDGVDTPADLEKARSRLAHRS